MTQGAHETQRTKGSADKPVSALQRLLSLPAIFSGRDLTIRFGWTSKNASQYLYLWKKRGLVQALGGHSDTFANLIVQPQADWEEGLRHAMPSAVIVGVEALRRRGWTTQIQARPDVVVQESLPVYTLNRFNVSARPAAWFEASRKGIANGALAPAWALADMLAREGWGACGLAPDDIEWGAIKERDRGQWTAACKAYRLMLEVPEFASRLA
jgi:hypothetical protein